MNRVQHARGKIHGMTACGVVGGWITHFKERVDCSKCLEVVKNGKPKRDYTGDGQ